MNTTTKQGVKGNNEIIGRTNLGYALIGSSTYRFTTVSGTIHVDEYVAMCGQWVYMGTIKAVPGHGG